MSNLERWLWAVDFVISGIGWFFGGPYAALLCFTVAGLLIFIALTTKEQGDSKHRILIDEHTAYIGGVKKWHKWGIGISIICVLSLVSYGVIQHVKKPLPIVQSDIHPANSPQSNQSASSVSMGPIKVAPEKEKIVKNEPTTRKNTENCRATNSTTSNGVYRNGAVPNLSNDCNSRFVNNLTESKTQGKDRPKFKLGGKENEIERNTFPEMPDIETTDTAQGNKVRHNLFGKPPASGKSGDGADVEKIRDAQTASVYKCDEPCGAYGAYPDYPIEGLAPSLPLAKALHGSSHTLADNLSSLIDEGNAIFSAFIADSDVDTLNKKQKTWQAKVETAISDLDPRLGDALTHIKSLKDKIAVLTIYQNQLRAAGENGK
jgi:hypothetical protein